MTLLVSSAATFAACDGGSLSGPPVPSAVPTGASAAASTRPSVDPPSLAPTATASADPAAVTVVSDASGAISISVPVGWSVASVRWYHGDDERGPALVASPDPVAFASAFDGRTGSAPRWGVDGVFVGVSRSLARELGLADLRHPIVALARWHGGDEETERGWNGMCLRDGASVLDSADGESSGFVTNWRDCGEVGTLLLDLGATDREGSYVAQALVVMTEGDVGRDRAVSILESLAIDEAALER